MTDPDAGLSPELTEALREEHAALAKRISESRARADKLRAMADRAAQLADKEERYLKEVEILLGMAPEMCLDSLSMTLRGQRLQEVAVEILSREVGPGKPIHYRQWYELLREAGHHVGGKDPLANFLAHVTRAPEVERVAPRSGVYRLRAVA